MKATSLPFAVILTLFAALVAACAEGGSVVRAPLQASAKPAAADAPVVPSTAVQTRVAVDDVISIGSGAAFDNLTVMPVFSTRQDAVEPMVSLDDAVASHTAVLRETGPNGESGNVNQLYIENHGALPLYALAGTVVTGGRQDREIAQDLVVAPNKTVPVEAYCVEHGRWTPQREGVATLGRFGALDVLAPTEVRAAGQYEESQSDVWKHVQEVNAANGKSANSDTLAVSIDDPGIVSRRTAIANQVLSFLESVNQRHDVVGVAYAIDGHVRAVRWFANRQLYELHRDTLAQTASFEAITADAAKGHDDGVARAAPHAPATPAKARQLVMEVRQGEAKGSRATSGSNTNEYRESKHGYGSTTTLAGGESAVEASVSWDFVAK